MTRSLGGRLLVARVGAVVDGPGAARGAPAALHPVPQPGTGVHAAIRVGVSPPPMLKTCPKKTVGRNAGCVGAADHLDPQLLVGRSARARRSASPDAPGRRRHLALPGPAARVLRLAVGAPHPPPCGQRGTDRGDIASAIRAADAAGNAPAPLGDPRHGGMNRALREAARKPGPALPRSGDGPDWSVYALTAWLSVDSLATGAVPRVTMTGSGSRPAKRSCVIDSPAAQALNALKYNPTCSRVSRRRFG